MNGSGRTFAYGKISSRINSIAFENNQKYENIRWKIKNILDNRLLHLVEVLQLEYPLEGY
jgi:hypothetical protein